MSLSARCPVCPHVDPLPFFGCCPAHLHGYTLFYVLCTLYAIVHGGFASLFSPPRPAPSFPFMPLQELLQTSSAGKQRQSTLDWLDKMLDETEFPSLDDEPTGVSPGGGGGGGGGDGDDRSSGVLPREDSFKVRLEPNSPCYEYPNLLSPQRTFNLRRSSRESGHCHRCFIAASSV